MMKYFIKVALKIAIDIVSLFYYIGIFVCIVLAIQILSTMKFNVTDPFFLNMVFFACSVLSYVACSISHDMKEDYFYYFYNLNSKKSILTLLGDVIICIPAIYLFKIWVVESKIAVNSVFFVYQKIFQFLTVTFLFWQLNIVLKNIAKYISFRKEILRPSYFILKLPFVLSPFIFVEYLLCRFIYSDNMIREIAYYLMNKKLSPDALRNILPIKIHNVSGTMEFTVILAVTVIFAVLAEYFFEISYLTDKFFAKNTKKNYNTKDAIYLLIYICICIILYYFV